MSESNEPRRGHPRVTHRIQAWFGKRWRVDVMLDGYAVKKAYFDDYPSAIKGGIEMEDQVIEEANLQ